MSEQFPAPEPGTAIEPFGQMQVDPTASQRVEQQGAESATAYAGRIVPVEKREPLFSIGPDDPRYAKLMAEHNINQARMQALARNATVEGDRN